MAIDTTTHTAGATTMVAVAVAVAGVGVGVGTGATISTSASTSTSTRAVPSSRSADKDLHLTGLFPDRDSAERAYQGVIASGQKLD